MNHGRIPSVVEKAKVLLVVAVRRADGNASLVLAQAVTLSSIKSVRALFRSDTSPSNTEPHPSNAPTSCAS